jgi:hypothetical protein
MFFSHECPMSNAYVPRLLELEKHYSAKGVQFVLIHVGETDVAAAVNPRNPNRPPRTVGWGEETTDEMCVAFIHFTKSVGDLWVRTTIRVGLALWSTAVLGMLLLPPRDWTAATGCGRLVRLLWTAACVVYAVHVAAALHFVHGWSHEHAVEHTRDLTGFGGGIWFSHAFGALWVADAVWWWVAPAGYAARPAWVGRALHLYMLFIIVNGTVVFESGPVRIAGVIGLALLAAVWVVSLRRSSAPGPDAPAGAASASAAG